MHTAYRSTRSAISYQLQQFARLNPHDNVTGKLAITPEAPPPDSDFPALLRLSKDSLWPNFGQKDALQIFIKKKVQTPKLFGGEGGVKFGTAVAQRNKTGNKTGENLHEFYWRWGKGRELLIILPAYHGCWVEQAMLSHSGESWSYWMEQRVLVLREEWVSTLREKRKNGVGLLSTVRTCHMGGIFKKHLA